MMKSLAKAFLVIAQTMAFVGCGNPQAENSFSEPSALYPSATLQQVPLWKVTAYGGLNCRTDAGTHAPIVYSSLPEGTFMDAMASDYPGVFQTKKDGQGRLWVHVNPRGGVDHTPCYVLGEDRYIKPVVTKTGSLSALEGDLSCQSHIRYSETFAYAETSDHRIYICKSANRFAYLSYNKGSSTPALTLWADAEQVTSASQQFSATFVNGDYRYILSGLESSRYPVLNLMVIQSGVEFPVLLNTPADKFYR